MTAPFYQKIPGPFRRDPDTNKLTREFTSEAIGDLADAQWIFTEKIDGTNIRIHWDGHRVSIGGRTENAQIPAPLLRVLTARFLGEDNETIFEQEFGSTEVTLFGEGYGAKIQSGGKYAPEPSFALFDVRVGEWDLLRPNVESVADYFGIQTAPVVLQGKLWEGIGLVSEGLYSRFGDFLAEGLVGVTRAGLRDRNGDRIIVKLKTRDLYPVLP